MSNLIQHKQHMIQASRWTLSDGTKQWEATATTKEPLRGYGETREQAIEQLKGLIDNEHR